MQHNSSIKEVLIDEQRIKQRIKELGQQISNDYQGKTPLFIGVLKGAWVYMADLLREIDVDCDVDFMSVSSYGNGRQTSGGITIVKDLSVDCEGRDVIVVEDIVDSGITLSRLKELLLGRKAKSVEMTTLLSKPSRRIVDVDVKYIGFEIPDKFVIGYGLDWDGRMRHLRDVCVPNE